MILYLSDEDSDTYVQSCKSAADLPQGVRLMILETEATNSDRDRCEHAIDCAFHFFAEREVK